MKANSYKNYPTLINANSAGNIFYVDLELIAGKNLRESCEHGTWHYNNDTSNILIREIAEINKNNDFYTFGIKMIVSFSNQDSVLVEFFQS